MLSYKSVGVLGRSCEESSVEQFLGAKSSTNNGLSRIIGADIFILKTVRDQKDKSCTACNNVNLM